ncbi:MATE family efflux transporter [Anaerotalea alkaliphila]|uniref:Multidrug export protein MepA n=1 Tax=Anaerotalea alkaliphila TaxID=2662126 RepID=A0A7X5HUS4_9FIRM|nr:MATE family efflux transporter [Anaerotalea alkaliphila]NDL66955.1 MATE family efflux transporter [Anaerotalea alkaliphila]
MADKRLSLLKDAPISKAINQMSLPAIGGMLVMAIYNVVDTMFVAWLGTDATSATQVVMPLMMLTSAFGLAFGIGGGSYLSRLLGQSDLKKADAAASVSLFSAVGFGILFTLLCLWRMEGVLELFGARGAVLEEAKAYGFHILLGSTFAMGNMTLNNLLRSEGSAKLAMVGMGVGSILNVFLDPLFIFGFGWGIGGAALATTLSQGVTFLIQLSHYRKGRSVIRIGLRHWAPNRELFGEIMKVGVPTFLRQMLFSVSIGFLNNGAVLHGGNELLAAVGIVSKAGMLPMYVILGIGQGFQPVVGYNFGAGNKPRVLEALRYTLLAGAGVAGISSLGMFLFGEWFLGIFKASEAVTAYGVRGLRMLAAAIVLMAVTNTIGIFYQALGKGLESLLLSVARQGLFYIPAIFLAPLHLGTDGILGAQAIADTLTFLLTLSLFLPYMAKDRLSLEMDSRPGPFRTDKPMEQAVGHA